MFSKKIKATVICVEGLREIYNNNSDYDEVYHDFYDEYRAEMYHYEHRRSDIYYKCRLLKIRFSQDENEVVKELHNIIRNRPFSLNEIISIRIKNGIISIDW